MAEGHARFSARRAPPELHTTPKHAAREPSAARRVGGPMSGWLIWLALTALHAWCGWSWACNWITGSSALERFIAAMVFTLAGLIGVEMLCVAFSVFTPSWLIFTTLAWLAITRFATRDARTTALLLNDSARIWWVARERFTPITLLYPLALLAFVASCALTYWFRAWNYDGTVYHTPIAYLLVRYGSLEWPGITSVWIQGYPFDVSLLSAWNIIFTREKVFDDAAQLPFVVLAMAAIAWWCRFFNASRAISLALGASFILLSPVWLQSMHTQVDIACAALFIVVTRFLLEPMTKGRAMVVFCALGIYLGTKFTGALHLVALTPWLAWWLRANWRWALPRAVFLLLGLGGARYLINVLAHGTPFWPFWMNLPLLGRTEGLIDPGPINLSRSGSSGAFFGAPNSIGYMLYSWYHDDSALWPDVRSGGFGFVFRWLLLPCLGLLAIDVLRRRPNAERALILITAFILALIVPMPWWPRYTLAAGGLSLVAIAGVLSDRARGTWIIASLLVGLLAFGWATTLRNLVRDVHEYKWPALVHQARKATPHERERIQATTWLWPPEFIDARDAQFADGGVLLFDETGDFASEFFAKGIRNDPHFMSNADPKLFADQIKTQRACWAIVAQDSKAETELKQRGMKLLFQAPRTSGRVYDTGQCR